MLSDAPNTIDYHVITSPPIGGGRGIVMPMSVCLFVCVCVCVCLFVRVFAKFQSVIVTFGDSIYRSDGH